MADIPKPPTSRKGVPPLPSQAIANLDKPETNATKGLSFKLPEAFHREFKTYAAQNGISMQDLLIETFEALKEKRGY